MIISTLNLILFNFVIVSYTALCNVVKCSLYVIYKRMLLFCIGLLQTALLVICSIAIRYINIFPQVFLSLWITIMTLLCVIATFFLLVLWFDIVVIHYATLIRTHFCVKLVTTLCNHCKCILRLLDNTSRNNTRWVTRHVDSVCNNMSHILHQSSSFCTQWSVFAW